MAIKPVTIVFLLLFSLFLVLASSSLEWNHHQPEERLRQCQRQCESREEQQRPQCRQKCVEDFQREQEEQHRGGGRDPKKQLEECRKECKREYSEEREQRSQCEQQCERQRKEHERGGKGNNMYEGSEEEEEQQQQQGNNPYVFEDQHFTTKIRTEHGKVRILQKFTERSKLLKGIENYRVSILEADPQTFIIPNHWDAEALFFVARGM